MKVRTKVITGISIALVIILLIIVVDQRWKADLNESQATNDTIQQQESAYSTVDKNKEKDVEDVTNIEERSEDKGTEGNGTVDPQKDLVQESESIAESNPTTPLREKPEDESSTSEVNKDVPKTSTENHTSGLYFATREEAIAFGFSRFSAEEIQIYNQVSANGLTPEQEEVALQIAYSRFTAAEIAAIEAALNR